MQPLGLPMEGIQEVGGLGEAPLSNLRSVPPRGDSSSKACLPPALVQVVLDNQCFCQSKCRCRKKHLQKLWKEDLLLF